MSFLHKLKVLSKNSPPKVHPNYAKNLGRQILGNTFSGPDRRGFESGSGGSGSFERGAKLARLSWDSPDLLQGPAGSFTRFGSKLAKRVRK